MKHHIFTALAIGLCLFLGKGLAYIFPILPGSLFGMMLFACLLALGIIDDKKTGLLIAKVIYYMPIVFLPICLGVISYGDLIARIGYKLVIVGVLTSVSVIALVGRVGEHLLREQDKEDVASR